jgi:hypothetical protein
LVGCTPLLKEFSQNSKSLAVATFLRTLEKIKQQHTTLISTINSHPIHKTYTLDRIMSSDSLIAKRGEGGRGRGREREGSVSVSVFVCLGPGSSKEKYLKMERKHLEAQNRKERLIAAKVEKVGMESNSKRLNAQRRKIELEATAKEKKIKRQEEQHQQKVKVIEEKKIKIQEDQHQKTELEASQQSSKRVRDDQTPATGEPKQVKSKITHFVPTYPLPVHGEVDSILNIHFSLPASLRIY